MERLDAAQFAYWERFKLAPPMPWGVADDRIAEMLERAVANGFPVSESFDWWQGLPPGAVA